MYVYDGVYICVYVYDGVCIQLNLRVTNPSGNEGVHKSELSVTLKSSTSLQIACCSLQFS